MRGFPMPILLRMVKHQSFIFQCYFGTEEIPTSTAQAGMADSLPWGERKHQNTTRRVFVASAAMPESVFSH